MCLDEYLKNFKKYENSQTIRNQPISELLDVLRMVAPATHRAFIDLFANLRRHIKGFQKYASIVTPLKAADISNEAAPIQNHQQGR